MRWAYLILSIMLASCSPFALNPSNYDRIIIERNAAWELVSSMDAIPDRFDYMQSPHEFFTSGNGDCEDFAAALVYCLGDRAQFVATWMYGAIHCIVLYNGEYLEPQRFGMVYSRDAITILWTLGYDEIMAWSTALGTKGALYGNSL